MCKVDCRMVGELNIDSSHRESQIWKHVMIFCLESRVQFEKIQLGSHDLRGKNNNKNFKIFIKKLMKKYLGFSHSTFFQTIDDIIWIFPTKALRFATAKCMPIG